MALTSSPIGLTAPMQGTIVTIDLLPGQPVRSGQQVMLIESMKMHHAIEATDSGIIDSILVTVGQTVNLGEPVATIRLGEVAAETAVASDAVDLDRIRPDLAETIARHQFGLDAARPDAVERRRKVHRRTARERG